MLLLLLFAIVGFSMLAFAVRANEGYSIPSFPDREWMVIIIISIIVVYGTFSFK